jgi:hypothetical protein
MILASTGKGEMTEEMDAAARQYRNAEATCSPRADVGANRNGSVFFTSIPICETAEEVVAAARQYEMRKLPV